MRVDDKKVQLQIKIVEGHQKGRSMGRKAGGGLMVGRILLRHKGIAPKAKNGEKAIPFDLMLRVV